MALSDSQNFLYSKRLVKELISKSNICSSDLVLEIGPGKGIITEELVKSSHDVIAVELDKNLYLKLKNRFSGVSNLELVNNDFLKTELPNKEYKVFSNIPFNMTADIINKLLCSNNPPKDMYLIMQYEAALKYAGEPYFSECMKSLMYKPYFDIEIIHEFSPQDFYPTPNVAIVLVHFHKKEYSDIKNSTRAEYWDFLSYIFDRRGGEETPSKKKLKKFFLMNNKKD